MRGCSNVAPLAPNDRPNASIDSKESICCASESVFPTLTFVSDEDASSSPAWQYTNPRVK